MRPTYLQQGTLRRAERERARRRRRRRALLIAGAALIAGLALAFAVLVSAGVTVRQQVVTANLVPPGSASRTARAAGSAATPGSARAASAGHTYATILARRQIRPRIAGRDLRSGLLFDVSTGRVLWARHATDELPIASLTKMMTALVTVARAPASAPVLITSAATHFTGSGVGLLPLGKRVRLETLLYGLLLPSGNDAAIALAQHVAGHQAPFVRLMNETAAAMGLTCTRFSSVSGILDAGNRSCATDLADLAHAVLTNRRLAPIVASRSAAIPFPIKGGRLFLFNNNPLLIERYPGADGVKTGYTVAAGPCLVAAARRGSAWYGVVLLHSTNPAGQAAELLDAAFAAAAPRRRADRARAVRRTH